MAEIKQLKKRGPKSKNRRRVALALPAKIIDALDFIYKKRKIKNKTLMYQEALILYIYKYIKEYEELTTTRYHNIKPHQFIHEIPEIENFRVNFDDPTELKDFGNETGILQKRTNAFGETLTSYDVEMPYTQKLSELKAKERQEWIIKRLLSALKINNAVLAHGYNATVIKQWLNHLKNLTLHQIESGKEDIARAIETNPNYDPIKQQMTPLAFKSYCLRHERMKLVKTQKAKQLHPPTTKQDLSKVIKNIGNKHKE